MSKGLTRRVASILALAMAVGSAALLQVGCLADVEHDQGVGEELVATEVAPAAGDEDAVNATGDFWDVPYISVLQPSGTIGPKVIDIKDLSLANGARAQLWQRNGGLNQAWTVWDIGSFGASRGYALINANSGKCLDMAIDGAVGNGTRVQQWTCNFTANQEWLADGGSGWVTLRNRQRPDLCLDVTNVKYANGALLQVWTCSGNWNQRWNIFP